MPCIQIVAEVLHYIPQSKSNSEPRKIIQGFVIIRHAWSGCVGGWCTMQPSVSGMCECAAEVLEVHVSLHSTNP